MKTRVTIEYDLPAGDCVTLREREEQRWITYETVLALPGSTTVKVQVVEHRTDDHCCLPSSAGFASHTAAAPFSVAARATSF